MCTLLETTTASEISMYTQETSSRHVSPYTMNLATFTIAAAALTLTCILMLYVVLRQRKRGCKYAYIYKIRCKYAEAEMVL